jgi:glycosyltransferase involved in cell wall biosynthesis
MLVVHRALGTWSRNIDLYVALTRFQAEVMTRGGLPPGRIVTKPNFVPIDPGPGQHQEDIALYVGRLTEEKGIPTLLEAWRGLSDVPLAIIGDGPLRGAVEAASSANPAIRYLGQATRTGVMERMRSARLLVMPSVWYETFGLVAVEAFACGLPVVGSDLGCIKELITDAQAGACFRAGDAGALEASVRQLWTDEARRARMSENGRRMFEQAYTPERNYDQLLQIYERALSQ